MKNFLLLLFCLHFCPVFGQNEPPKEQKTSFKLPEGIKSNDYLPGIVLVKFRKGISKTQISSISSHLSSKNLSDKSIGTSTINQLFKNSISAKTKAVIDRMAITDTIGLDRVYELRVNMKLGVEKVINELMTNPMIEYAEPNYIYHTSYVPKDPLYARFQSSLKQVKAEEAWELFIDSSNSIIAIVDSGSDLDHEDLKANILVPGIDLVGSSFSNLKVDNDPSVKSDSTDHGVRVSGVASAITNNGIGIASIASNAKLMIVKVGADDNSTAIYRGYEGIKYAADHGANIINCSWGGPAASLFGQDIINYAILKGSLIVAAAGNGGTSLPEYPAAIQGVLAVASVDINDKRNDYSNYGNHISISAPGELYTTKNNNDYTLVRGTSFSTPLVSSAAALLRAKFPQYDMFQIAEQLKVTADNIDAINPTIAGKLGSGRLNVFRALTESLPSIKYQNVTILDKGNGSIPSGDTISIFLDVKNFLAPVSELVVKLSTTNPNVQVIDQALSLAGIGTKELKKLVGPFRVYIKPGISDNEPVDFKLNYTSGSSYAAFEYFQIIASKDFINVQVNKVSSTITSNGRIGFRDSENLNGLGFQYKSNPLLFEAALMIGNSPSTVSNNARSRSGEADEHFIKRVRAFKDSDTQAAFLGRSEFDDSGNPNPLSLYVKHSQTAFSSSPDDQYVLAEYEVTNTGANILNGVYVGLFTDWDIDQSGRDATKYDAVNRLAYAFGKSDNSPYAGVKLLSQNSKALYYPMSYQIQGDLLESANEFSIAEKYQTLSSGIKATGLGDNVTNGYDISFVSGYGPFTIPVNGKIKLAFALVAGDSLDDLQASAIAAQNKYNEVNKIETPNLKDGFVLKQNFPNPGLNQTAIEFTLSHSGLTTLVLYNTMGQFVKELIKGNLAAGQYNIAVDLSGLEPGIYLYKLQFEGKERTLKMLISR